ncbi:MAG: P-loop NTPase [Sphingobium sp.]|uniref:P-loop NTPase n=1 Tax=Sphingobium sp. TaxID=1912891 RepID=UPI0029AA0DF6|nr:P-loop NTPase [Sphingobium sp.]MDX3908963.1 P-loop NTPase [Sphingobium sp.]
MTKYSPIDMPRQPGDSLLERASDLYDFGSVLRGTGMPPIVPQVVEPTAVVDDAPASIAPQWYGPMHSVDREGLEAAGFVLPDGPVSGISEEFRIVKRQLLSALRGDNGEDALALGNRILVCSAHPGEGKTFCAVNLALSMAAEKDIEVLLVDADFAKPSIVSTLGLPDGPGFMDVLADPSLPIEECVLRTEFASLAVLPAGNGTNNDTEYLASARTRQLLDTLTAGNPNRILLFDSPPLLAASPAAVLAGHVGQALMVVRADSTTENALRDAANLLKACAHVQLLLNGVKFSASGRRFGNYYGKAA